MNVIQTWLWLIGNAERAKKLRTHLERDKHNLRHALCPSVVLFGDKVSYKLYAHRPTQLALDAWDTGEVTKEDLIRYCLLIETGKYNGPVYGEKDFNEIREEIRIRIKPYVSFSPAYQVSQVV